MTTDCETHLVLWNANFYPDVISILARLCPAVKHISFDLPCTHLDPVTDDHHMPMRSVITVCFKSMHCFVTLQEFSVLFPNAKSLDMIMDKNKYSPLRNLSSLSLRDLKLRYTEMYSYNETTDSLFMDISTSCPNILSLVLSGIGFPSENSGKDITSLKLPHLTNIHLEPIGKLECCRFTTFTNVLHAVHLTNPCLKFVEAKKVRLGSAELTSVKWSRTSSGYELQLKGASTAVRMADLIHLVSNELKGVTVLTFDRCKVSHPSMSIGRESSLRELKFLNVENPQSETDIHKLSEMYPNVKVTVEHHSQASHEYSKYGTWMPFKPERKTSPSSPPFPTSSTGEFI